jgi:hypothetical protein
MVCLCYGLRLERGGDSHEKPSLLSPQKQWGISSMWWGSPKDDRVAYQCILMPIVLSMLLFSTISTCVQHIGIYVLSMVYCIAGRGFTKGSTVITWRDCGCRREGGHNASTVCEIFLSFSLSSSFPVVLWSTKLIGLQGVHLHLFPSYLPTLKYCHNQ